MCASKYRLQNSGEAKRDKDSAAAPLETVDVSEILKANYQKARQCEKPLDLSKPKSRRKRDYWLGMCVVNGALIAWPVLTGWALVDSVFALSGVVIFSAGFTWAMWMVMSDY